MEILSVIDTNVLVAALYTKYQDAATARLLYSVYARRINPVIHSGIISEYGEVLRRDKFNFDVEMVNTLINFFIDNGLNCHSILVPTSYDIYHFPLAQLHRRYPAYEVCNHAANHREGNKTLQQPPWRIAKLPNYAPNRGMPMTVWRRRGQPHMELGAAAPYKPPSGSRGAGT